jgi:hypothetical protein
MSSKELAAEHREVVAITTKEVAATEKLPGTKEV